MIRRNEEPHQQYSSKRKKRELEVMLGGAPMDESGIKEDKMPIDEASKKELPEPENPMSEVGSFQVRRGLVPMPKVSCGW